MTRSVLPLAALMLAACRREPDDTCVGAACAPDTGRPDTAVDTGDSARDSADAPDSALDSAADSGPTVVPPTVAFARPAEGQVLDGSAVEVELSVTDFALSPDLDATPRDGVGHYHLSVDGAFFAEGSASTAWVTRLSSGAHVLGVELVGTDHRALTPSASASVSVTVPAEAPYVRIVPPDGYAGTWTSATLPFDLEVRNFVLDDDAIGEDASDGHGHYHVYLDGTYLGFAASSWYTLYNLENGTHTVSVVLSGNDHVESSVRDAWTFDVSDGRPDIQIDADGIVVDGSTARVPVTVENFTLVPLTEEEVAVEGEGHYHVYLDGAYAMASADASVTLEGLDAGSHMVMVELVDAEHNPIVPEVYDEVAFEVPDAR